MIPTPIQDQIPNNRCFGCGPLNPDGLHLKSRLDPAEPLRGDSIADFAPWPAHMAGPPHVLNGGIIATIFDCHAVCTAIGDAYVSEGLEIGFEDRIWYATAKLEVHYLAPTPLAGPVRLRARVTERSPRKRVVACTLEAGGEVRAEADVVAVRVPEAWRHGATG